MANVAKTYLSDKDIRNLLTKEKKYCKVVGSPKELYIYVNPKGTKKFALRLNVDGKEVFYGLKEFREGIYSVAKARKDAIAVLKRYQQLVSVDLLKNGNEKYSFGNLFKLCIEQKQKKGLSLDYLRKSSQMCEKYLLPSLAKRDVKTISYSDLLAILNAIYKPNNPATSRLDTNAT
ncbi:Arm DNA-binding domain-containing protein [Campylobacter troglodytis]|uniref:Arm DNA-binding domain-containing protein n=1 Tax=Campylobacter troglodytis TaxID=654363 RepID=UPI001FECD337|nr:Arm DNA-binding domain-containing protein [Campylobacter troglodytis]